MPIIFQALAERSTSAIAGETDIEKVIEMPLLIPIQENARLYVCHNKDCDKSCVTFRMNDDVPKTCIERFTLATWSETDWVSVNDDALLCDYERYHEMHRDID